MRDDKAPLAFPSISRWMVASLATARSTRSFQTRLFRLSTEGDSALPATCDGCKACLCGRPWRWRDACLKVRSGGVRDGISCGAKQREGHAVLPIAAAEATIHLQPTFWCARSARARSSRSAEQAGLIIPQSARLDLTAARRLFSNAV